MIIGQPSQTFFCAVGLFLRHDVDAVHEIGSASGWQIEVDEACKYLDQVGEFQRSEAALQLACLPNPTGLYITGGEPFSQLDDLDRLLACAYRNEMKVEVVTTGSWVSSETMAHEVLERFRSKLYLLSIYTTSALINHFGMRPIELTLNAAREMHMTVSIHCGISPVVHFPRELLNLEVLNSDTSVIRIDPLPSLMNGAQSPNASESFLLEEPPRYRRCAELFGFMISPKGEIYICAEGMGLPELRLGDLNTQTVEEIMRTAISRASLNKLRDEGPYYLYEACRESEERSLLYKGYVNSCHFHRHMLTNPALSSVISKVDQQLVASKRRKRRNVE